MLALRPLIVDVRPMKARSNSPMKLTAVFGARILPARR
jgi:hypothetical protein